MSTLYDVISALAGSGNYDCVTTHATIPVEFIDITGDTVYASNTTLGDATPDARMLVVHYRGNLIINTGVTVTAQARKRGMCLLVDGNCEIKGALSMTAKGAKDVAGDRILILGGYEIPAVGAAGAAYVFGGSNGVAGGNASDGQTGGGGSGGARDAAYHSGAGAAGTSYSGGSGGGGSRGAHATDGAVNGGAGGNGWSGSVSYGAGGGAGNPGGLGVIGSAYNAVFDGQSGTGGLLIVFVKGDLTISGSVISSGMRTSTIYNNSYGGGGSGGGSVNMFYGGTYTKTGTVTAPGGAAAQVSYVGGAGGAGSVREVQVSFAPSAPTIKRRFAQFI